MKYRAGERRKAVEYEKAISDWWKKNKTFEQSVENRPIDKSYVFYDGPPFITGNPHHGTLLFQRFSDPAWNSYNRYPLRLCRPQDLFPFKNIKLPCLF